MNKIFKVIYSKTKHCYVVVSELAKSHCKSTVCPGKSKTALTAAVLLALGTFSFLGMPGVAYADDINPNSEDLIGVNQQYIDSNDKNTTKTHDGIWLQKYAKNWNGKGAHGVGAITIGINTEAATNTIAIGERNASVSQNSVYIGAKYDAMNQIYPSSGTNVVSVGYNSDAAGTGSIAIGSGASADTFDNAGKGKNPDAGSQSIAIGNNANAKQNNIAIGAGSLATVALDFSKTGYLTGSAAPSSYISVGYNNSDTDQLLRRITNVADGAAASDVATVGQLQALSAKVGVYDAGFGIKIDTNTDKTNTIRLDRNLGKDYDTSDKVNLKNDKDNTSLILGGRVENDSSTGGKSVEGDYGALGKDSVTVGGIDNTVETTGDAAVVVGGTLNKASGKASTVVGGSANDAVAAGSSVFGGQDNDAYEKYATLSGGSWNKVYGEASSIFGGAINDASGASSVAVGGYNSHVYGTLSVGIAGGSTNADYALAAGREATVTVNNGTAIGYQATSNKEGTVAFGHDKDDVYYTSTWPQKATEKDGKYYDANNKEITKAEYESLRNADLTFNDYSQKPTVTENKYGSASYNRLVKVADGVDDHDVVVMEQLNKAKADLTNSLSINPGWGINIADEKDPKTGEVTKKNVISLNRNLGTNSGNTKAKENGRVFNGKVSFEAKGKNSLILGGEASTIYDKNVTAGTYGDYSVLVGGYNNSIKSAGKRAVVAAGSYNKASGENSAVIGGSYNQASGDNSVVIGGGEFSDDQGNQASGQFSTIIGGDGNTAQGINDVVSGGYRNVTSGDSSFIGGGQFNKALGFATAIIGGAYNMGVDDTTVVGGQLNLALSQAAFVAGGSANQVAGLLSTSIGGQNQRVIGNYSTAIGGASTGIGAEHATAIGSHAVVTSNNGLALGYKATADKEGTISFGHDKGDVSGYDSKIVSGPYGYYSGEVKSYLVPPASGEDARSVVYTPTYYDSAEYNRLVKVADGKDAHDAVTMEQLTPYTKSNASNIGVNLKTYTVGDDGETITETDATEEQQKANKDAWGEALGAGTFTTGTDTTATNASISDQLVTGKTLYDYDKPTDSQNYVNVNNTTGQNLSALDAQVKANADELDKPNHNIKFYSVDDKILKYLPKVGTYSNNEANDGAKGMGSMAAGVFTHSDGIASTVAGSYSGVLNQDPAGINDLRGAAALSYGTFNINQNTDATKEHSGVANSIIGQVNMTKDSNAAIIYGAGNIVTDSYRPIDKTKAAAILGSVNDPAKLGETMKDAVKESGGQVMVMGGGNSVDKAYMTQVVGVGNKVTGSGDAYDKDKSSQLNYVEGFYTTLTNGKNDYIIGSHNTVTGTSTETNQSNIVFGDNHTLMNTKNNVILGSLDAVDETTVSDVVSIGHNAKVTKEGGVAIGSGSEATTAAGVAGYDPTGATADTTAAWTSKKAAVSVGTADETRQITGVAAGKEETDAVNVAQLKKLNGMKANVNADNIGKNLNHKADGTAVTEEDKTANENAWGAAIGTGSIAADNGQLVTGKTVYEYNKPVAAEGKTLNYISDTKTTGQNLTALDTQIKTNADNIGTNTTNISNNTENITNLKNLSNITEAGQTVIKNLAKGSIGMEDGSHTSVSHRDVNGVETYKVDVTVDGQVAENNTGIVNGGTVYSALQDIKNQTSADLANKANVDASNLTPNNVTKWQEKLGNGQVVSGNTGLVTGDTVFQAVDTKANRDGSNLTADEANKFSEKIAVGKVEANDKHAVSGETVSKAISDLTGDMNTKLDGKANTSLDNITKDGQTVIKKLSQDAVQVKAGDDHITVDAKTDETTGNKTYTISAKDGKVASGDTGLISGGTLYNEVHVDKDGSYIKSGNTVGNNLSALDTGLKNTSSLIHTNTSGDTIHIGETSKATKVDVSSTDANGNKNGRVVTGVVTDAKDANSAANVGYVNGVTAANTQQIYREMNNAYGNLNRNINRAAAGSNALAALHPLDYDPADKASFAVGYGHYRNANAAAIGAFYYPNANTMVNVGVSVGNGDPGFNAGVSFKLGKGSAYNGVSKAEMAQTIHDQAEEISAIKANDAAKDKRIDALEKENQEMKKQIQEILSRLNG